MYSFSVCVLQIKTASPLILLQCESGNCGKLHKRYRLSKRHETILKRMCMKNVTASQAAKSVLKSMVIKLINVIWMSSPSSNLVNEIYFPITRSKNRDFWHMRYDVKSKIIRRAKIPGGRIYVWKTVLPPGHARRLIYGKLKIEKRPRVKEILTESWIRIASEFTWHE
jgi:hypothetical protein